MQIKKPHPLVGQTVLYRIEDDYAGNPQHRPAIVIRTWGQENDMTCAVQLAVIPDGTNDQVGAIYAVQNDAQGPLAGQLFGFVWVTSVSHGTGQRQWQSYDEIHGVELQAQEASCCCQNNLVTNAGQALMAQGEVVRGQIEAAQTCGGAAGQVKEPVSISADDVGRIEDVLSMPCDGSKGPGGGGETGCGSAQ